MIEIVETEITSALRAIARCNFEAETELDSRDLPEVSDSIKHYVAGAIAMAFAQAAILAERHETEWPPPSHV
jgi:hypothetical protein